MGAKNKKAIFIIGIELLVIIAVLIAAVIHSHNLIAYDVDLSGSAREKIRHLRIVHIFWLLECLGFCILTCYQQR